MRHDHLPPPTASRTELLPCAPPVQQQPPMTLDGDLDTWLFACSPPVPAAATPTDLLEADVHVRTQCDLLADLPFDWELPLALPPSKTESLLLPPSPRALYPESPCSVALEAGLQVAQPLLPRQLWDDFWLDSLTLPSEVDVKTLLNTEDGDDNSGENEFTKSVKRERTTSWQPPSVHQPAEQPWYATFTDESDSLAGETSGKERLRKRQRAYEQKYRKKKRVSDCC